jgi:hypothetical protein
MDWSPRENQRKKYAGFFFLLDFYIFILYISIMKTYKEGDNTMTNRPIYQIANEISRDWKNKYFGAVPYLNAMRDLDSIKDKYIMDSGKSIVVYFLCNATTWRGETARRIKKELKDMIK